MGFFNNFAGMNPIMQGGILNGFMGGSGGMGGDGSGGNAIMSLLDRVKNQRGALDFDNSPNRNAYNNMLRTPEDTSTYDPNKNYMNGGTPMDAGQPAPYLDQGGQHRGMGGGRGFMGMIKNAMGGGQGGGWGQGGFGGGGQQFGPWGSAMSGGMNPGQGQFSSNNMGMFGSSPQQPFGMGNNPMNNFMNPYQGNMFGNMGNPNQRQPFMGGGFGGGMSGSGYSNPYASTGNQMWQPQQQGFGQMMGAAQGFLKGFGGM